MTRVNGSLGVRPVGLVFEKFKSQLHVNSEVAIFTLWRFIKMKASRVHVLFDLAISIE